MEKQSVIVVGGASGLGLVTARLMLERGARRVGLIDRNDALLAQAAEALRAGGHDVAIAVGDISRKETAHAAFKTVARSFGRVDALINSAAIYPRQTLLDISDEEWDLETAINIKGTYHMMVAAVSHMRRFAAPPAVAGRIVNVTSVDAFKAHPQNAHYTNGGEV